MSQQEQAFYSDPHQTSESAAHAKQLGPVEDSGKDLYSDSYEQQFDVIVAGQINSAQRHHLPETAGYAEPAAFQSRQFESRSRKKSREGRSLQTAQNHHQLNWLQKSNRQPN